MQIDLYFVFSKFGSTMLRQQPQWRPPPHRNSLDEKLSCIHLDDKSCRSRGIWSKHGVLAESFCYSMASTSRPISFCCGLWGCWGCPLSFSITSKTMSYLPGNHATSTQKSLDAFTFGLGGLTRTTASQGLHSSQGQLQAKSLRHQATSCTASGQFACRSHRRVSLFL